MRKLLVVLTTFLAGVIVALSAVGMRSKREVLAQAPATWNGRLFYVTKNRVAGNAALTACAAGYHMASLFEIYNVSTLKYDTANGATSDDSGFGPPTPNSFGWVRTGYSSFGAMTDDIGQANCNAWTSNSPNVSGTVVYLSPGWRTPGPIFPWGVEILGTPGHPTPPPCNNPEAVWCVQN